MSYALLVNCKFRMRRFATAHSRVYTVPLSYTVTRRAYTDCGPTVYVLSLADVSRDNPC